MKRSSEATPMEGVEVFAAGGSAAAPVAGEAQKPKPPFRPAEDDTKPVLRDPILRSDPIESEQAVLLLPRFP